MILDQVADSSDGGVTFAQRHMPDDVPDSVKTARLNEIIALQNTLSAESNARDVGKEFEILVEGTSKRSDRQLFAPAEKMRNSSNTP